MLSTCEVGKGLSKQTDLKVKIFSNDPRPRLYIRLRRPAVLLALASVLPGYLLYYQKHFLLIIFLISLLFIAVFAQWRISKFRLLIFALVLINIARSGLAIRPPTSLGNINQEFSPHNLRVADKHENFELDLNLGKILWESEKTNSFLVVASMVKGTKLVIELDHKYKSAKKIRAECIVSKPEPSSNPGGFNEKDWLAGKSVFYKVSPRGPVIVTRYRSKLFLIRENLISRYRFGLETYCADESVGLLLSLLLGDKSLLDKKDKLDFNQLGLGHLLAVSGMHLNFLLKAIDLGDLRARFGYKFEFRAKFLSLLLWFYLAKTPAGFFRSGLIWFLKELSKQKCFRSDSLNTLALAFTISGIMNPFCLLDKSIIWSYGASGALFLWSEPLTKKLKQKFKKTSPKLLDSMASLFSAQLAIILLNLSQSRSISPLLLVWQPLFINIAEIIFIMGLLSFSLLLILGMKKLILVKIFLWPLNQLAQLFIRLSRSLLDARFLSNLSFSINYIMIFLFLTHVGFKILGKWRRMYRFKSLMTKTKIIFISVSLILSLIWQITPRTHADFYVLDVGQGDGFVLKTGNKTILFDGGTRDKSDSVILPFMDYMGISFFDLAIVSHSDQDHSGAVLELMEMGKIKELVLPLYFSEAEFEYGREQGWTQVLAKAGEEYVKDFQEPPYPEEILWQDELTRLAWLKGIKINRALPGLQKSIDKNSEINFSVLGASMPTDRKSFDTNSYGLFCMLDLKGKLILLTADANLENEDLYIRQDNKRIDYLKISHHGSKTGTTSEFLNVTKPRLAIISVGANNYYGHPHPEVITRIADNEILLLRTDEDGCIRISLDNNALSAISTWKSRRLIYDVE